MEAGRVEEQIAVEAVARLLKEQEEAEENDT